ncbi:unnamed protein product [Rotaria sp. Silwood2]|nr:unnamed protein product [Rotaria sp. Silwood2]
MPDSIEKWMVLFLLPNNDDCEEIYKISLDILQDTVDSIETFTEFNRCADFIKTLNNTTIYLIVSKEINEEESIILENCSSIMSIYLLNRNNLHEQQWIKSCKKFKEIYINIKAICDNIKQHIHLFRQNVISINVTSQESATNLDELDPSFMYSQLLKEILLEMPHDDNEKTNFVNFCNQKYTNNESQMKIVIEFDQQYNKTSPIWWYTRECFLYWMLNTALRTHDTDTILKMGFFLRDLHGQIEKLYLQNKPCNSLVLFRGQGMSFVQFDKMNKTKGGLLSFNNFLSISTDRQVAYLYADSARQNSNLIGVIFIIEIDPSVTTTSFAFVQDYSFYGSTEEEIIMSMHSVFRIGELEQIDYQLWQIKLKLTSDNDPLLKRLTEYIRHDIEGETPLYRMNNLMMIMGHYDKAEEIIRKLQNTTSEKNGQLIAELNYQMGNVLLAKGELNNALDCLKKTLEFEQNVFSPNDPTLSYTYRSVGSVYDSMGDYKQSLMYYEKALEIQENSLSWNPLELCNTYTHIGLLYEHMGEYSKAIIYLEKNLENQI